MQINLSLGFSRDVENEDFFGYLERINVTFTVNPRFDEFQHFDTQSAGQKSHCVDSF